MNKYTGKSVFGGIAIGKIMVYEKGEHQVKRVKITDAEAEKNRYYEAVEIAFKQLGELHDKALREVGEANAAISLRDTKPSLCSERSSSIRSA